MSNDMPVLTNYVEATAPVCDHAIKLFEAASSVRKNGQTGMKGFASGRHDIFRLNPYLISVRPGLNARVVDSPENREHIDALARSIAVNGVVHPVTVFWENDAPVLTDGECRLLGTFRAIEVYGAQIETIPAKTEAKGTNEADRLLTQIISNSGKPFNVFETGAVFKRLIAFGWSEATVAERAAVSISKVKHIIELSAAPEAMKRMVLDGKVSASLVWETLKTCPSDDQAVATIEAAVTKAESQGKTRATKKHLDLPRRPSLKEIVLGALNDSKVENVGKEVCIIMKNEQYMALRDAIDW